MASYLILGGGKFGRLAVERLADRDSKANFLIVDRDAVSLAVSDLDSRYRQVQSEAISFLVQHLKGEVKWDWIIPMVPVHVAYQWLVNGPLAGLDWQPIAIPAALEQLGISATRGPEGELYLSRAQYLCPDDCFECGVCPVTGESRALPLYQELISIILPGYQVRVVPSRQLAPGVGGYSPRQLLELSENFNSLTGNVLIATACCCHGVINGLVFSPGD